MCLLLQLLAMLSICKTLMHSKEFLRNHRMTIISNWHLSKTAIKTSPRQLASIIRYWQSKKIILWVLWIVNSNNIQTYHFTRTYKETKHHLNIKVEEIMLVTMTEYRYVFAAKIILLKLELDPFLGLLGRCLLSRLEEKNWKRQLIDWSNSKNWKNTVSARWSKKSNCLRQNDKLKN